MVCQLQGIFNLLQNIKDKETKFLYQYRPGRGNGAGRFLFFYSIYLFKSLFTVATQK